MLEINIKELAQCDRVFLGKLSGHLAQKYSTLCENRLRSGKTMHFMLMNQPLSQILIDAL
jgi:hypothetical protein